MKRDNKNLFNYIIITLLVIIIVLQFYSGPQMAPKKDLSIEELSKPIQKCYADLTIFLEELISMNPRSDIGDDTPYFLIHNSYKVQLNDDGCLFGLFFWDEGIIGIPESIGNLNTLEWVELTRNQLTSLPEGIGNLHNLGVLRVERNQLTSIPERIGNLGSLERLNLGYNQLTILPESFGNLDNLEYLFLQDNQLTILPESFSDLGNNLKILHLYNNQLCNQYPYPWLEKFCYEDNSLCMLEPQNC